MIERSCKNCSNRCHPKLQMNVCREHEFKESAMQARIDELEKQLSILMNDECSKCEYYKDDRKYHNYLQAKLDKAVETLGYLCHSLKTVEKYYESLDLKYNPHDEWAEPEYYVLRDIKRALIETGDK